MIWIDKPKQYQVNGLMRNQPFRSAHMVSDLLGESGTSELIAFGKLIGIKPAWLQKPGTCYEHFDVMNTRYCAALAAGARQMDSYKCVSIFRTKREASNGG